MNVNVLTIVMAILVIVVLAMVLFLVRWIMQTMIGSIRDAVRLQESKLEEMRLAICQVASSKRLATYLEIERKGGLPISPLQFEANKPVLTEKMLAEVDEQVVRERSEPKYAVYNIFNKSGFDAFIDHKTREKLTEAMSRLYANNDLDGLRQFIRDTVAAL